MSSKKTVTQLTPLKQLTLNFGQKPATNKTITCQKCGMVYNSNSNEDEQTHAKYHRTDRAEKEKMLNYSSSSKHEKIVQTYLDGGKCVVLQWGIDSTQALAKALQILDYVDEQLGINEPRMDSNQFNPRNIKNLTKFYMYVSNGKIVGFCLAEPITVAHRISYVSTTGFTYDETKGEKASCGISRIWVSEAMRRRGIATRLLDCVCSNFLYVVKLEPGELAFSDPTEFGQALAKSYVRADSFLVYNQQNKQI